MGRRKRPKADPTEDWEGLLPLFEWPEQQAYEELRPLVLFGSSVAERAGETGVPERTMYRRIERFETSVAVAQLRLFGLDALGEAGWLKAVNTLENGCGRRRVSGLTQAEGGQGALLATRRPVSGAAPQPPGTGA